MISLAMERDGEGVVDAAARAGNFKPVEVDCVRELWDAYQQSGEASGYIFVVGRDGERVLSFACFGPHPLTEGTFDLYWLSTLPEARRRGIGLALLARVEAEVRARAGRLLVVETSSLPDYSAARRFYESCGYRNEATIHGFYDPGDDLVIYVKELLPAS